MAHMMKHTKASCGHMFAHYDRKADHISNENLDSSKTHLNYNLAAHQQMGQGEFVKQRCSEVHCQNRKDVNVMVSWVVTAPKDLPEAELATFFSESYSFLSARYGRENIVSSYVHMDEVTPHMHFAFVPVVFDSKKDRYKVSAKEAVNRRDLKSFHEDLKQCLEAALKHEVGILNEATALGNKTVKELKSQSAAQQLQKAQERAIEVENAVSLLEHRQTALEASVSVLEGTEAYQRKLDRIQVKKLPGGFVVASGDEWNDVLKAAKESHQNYRDKNALQAKNEQLQYEKTQQERHIASLKTSLSQANKGIETLVGKYIDSEASQKEEQSFSQQLQNEISIFLASLYSPHSAPSIEAATGGTIFLEALVRGLSGVEGQEQGNKAHLAQSIKSLSASAKKDLQARQSQASAWENEM